MKTISDSIKQVRQSQQLSQNRFGYKIGISGKTISAYETGKCTPPLKVLERIAKTYKISVGTFTLKNDEILLARLTKLQEDLKELSQVIELQIIS